MRTVAMHILTAAMCAGALLAFGVAKAGEDAGKVEDFIVVEEDARIAFPRTINSYEIVDENRVLLRVGAGQLYLAELTRSCARDARWDRSIAIVQRGGPVDRYSALRIGDRVCQIETLARVERGEAQTG